MHQELSAILKQHEVPDENNLYERTTACIMEGGDVVPLLEEDVSPEEVEAILLVLQNNFVISGCIARPRDPEVCSC